MSKRSKRFLVLLLSALMVMSQMSMAVFAAADESSVFTIASEEDWNAFAQMVADGDNFAGTKVELTDDISVTTMAGMSTDRTFNGVFQGNGHTITFDYAAEEDFAAPFRFVNGAKFYNLKVTGTIDTTKKFAAGFVGQAQGSVIIDCCYSNITINSSVEGDGTHAGFVASLSNGYVHFKDCLFDGSIQGESTDSCGGFLGWPRTNNAYFRNCLNLGEFGTKYNNCGTFTRVYRERNISLSNCYYGTAYGAAQGSPVGDMSLTELKDQLNNGRNFWIVSGGKVVPFSFKAPSEVVELPIAKKLTYNGTDQELVEPGTAEGGVMQYALGTTEAPGEFSADIPTGKDAGDYEVWYKVAGESHLDVAPQRLGTVTIKKARITKDMFEAPTAVEGLQYNELPQVLINPGKVNSDDESLEMSYTTDLNKAFESDASEITGFDAGIYNVWYHVWDRDENYESTRVLGPVKVRISRGEPDHTKPVAKDLTYNGEAQELLEVPDDGNVRDGHFEYTLNKSGLGYSRKIPAATNAGSYTVYYKFVGDDNRMDSYGALNCSIGKADAAVEIEAEGWTYGERAKTPVVYINGEEVSSEYVTFEYKSESEDEFTDEVPVNAGSYSVKAVVSGLRNYNDAESEPADFTIEKADINLRLMIRGWKEGDYNPAVNSPLVFGNKGGGDVIIVFKEKSAPNTDYMLFTDERAAALTEGEYTIRAAAAETDNYNLGAANTYSFAVRQADPEMEILPEAIEGLTYMSDDEGNGVAQYLVYPGVSSNDRGHFEYYVTTDENKKPGVFTRFHDEVSEGTDAGTYYVWYQFVEKKGLIPDIMRAVDPIVVTISKADIDPAVSIEDWTYGDEASEPVVTGCPEDAEVTYEYRDLSVEDGGFVEGLPENAGSYELKANIAESANYVGGSCTTEFTVAKRAIEGFEWSDEDSFGYDGETHGVTAEVLGLVEGDEVAAELEDAEAVEAGSYTAKVTGLTGEKADNYFFSSDDPSAEKNWFITEPETPDEPEPSVDPATPEKTADEKISEYEKKITSQTDDKDIADSEFEPLLLRSTKQGKTSVKLTWTKVSGADKYVLYGSRCGKTRKLKKIREVSGKSFTVKNLKKGTYYKYVIAAYDKDGNKVSVSKMVHAATKGGKVGNHKKVTVKKSVINKAKKLKAGKSLKLNAKAVKQSKRLKVKKHVGIRYESTNTKVATVSKKGVVKAKSKGSCSVYVYAQSGVYKKIKVVVK